MLSKSFLVGVVKWMSNHIHVVIKDFSLLRSLSISCLVELLSSDIKRSNNFTVFVECCPFYLNAPMNVTKIAPTNHYFLLFS